MRKLTLLLILFPCLLAAQTKTAKKPAPKKKVETTAQEDRSRETILVAKDFTTDERGVTTNRNTILLNNGVEKPVDTKFIFLAPPDAFRTLGLAEINSITRLSNYRTFLITEKNPTYTPLKVTLIYKKDGTGWTCAVKFTVQSQDRALKEGTVFYDYDGSGKYENSLIDFKP